MSEQRLRQDLVQLLRGGQAHLTLKSALTGLPMRLRGKRPAGQVHSIWEVLEHMRIAQEDILRYTLEPDWRSPAWPEGYWPDNPDELPDDLWQKSLRGFEADLTSIIELVQDDNYTLSNEIPHGQGRSYLRQVLLVADHNSYHLGQIVQLRRALGDWPS